MPNSLRVRLTIWVVTVCASILLVISGGAYVLVALTLQGHVQANLRALNDAVMNGLSQETGEGRSAQRVATDAAEEISIAPEQAIGIFSSSGERVGARGANPPSTTSSRSGATAARRPPLVLLEDLRTLHQERGYSDLARDVAIGPYQFVVIARQYHERVAEDLETLRQALFVSVPVGLLLIALSAWFLIRHGLRPLELMSAQAHVIGAHNLDERLGVPGSRDELDRLATSFNALLDRVGATLERQRRFTADASHELRTPLSVIGSAAQITLQRQHRLEAEYRDALTIVEDETRRLRQIVEDMLTLARSDAGELSVQRSSLYLDDTIAEAVRAAGVLALAKGVDVAVAPTVESPYVGDEALLRRMILNLLDNAIRYTRPGTAVKVSLEYTADEYVVTVTDHGPGIPADAQAHVFDRFFQVEPARFHDHGGSGAGLGLAIASWVAGAHGGSVILHNSDDRGSTFVIRLPHRAHTG